MPGVAIKAFFLDDPVWQVDPVINSKRIDVALGTVPIGVATSAPVGMAIIPSAIEVMLSLAAIGVVVTPAPIEVSATLPDGIVVDVEEC